MHFFVGPCHVLNVDIAVPIENPADCEVRCVTGFLQANDILGYIAKEASSRVELFCSMTMHVRILPGRHKHCCVSNSIGISSIILLLESESGTVGLFPVSKNKGAPCW